jgi:hypothetical protein
MSILPIYPISQGLQLTTGQRLVETRDPDSRIGQYAAVISGQMKGWQGRLIRLTDTTATIDCAGGRQQPEIQGPLNDFVLMWVFVALLSHS